MRNLKCTGAYVIIVKILDTDVQVMPNMKRPRFTGPRHGVSALSNAGFSPMEPACFLKP